MSTPTTGGQSVPHSALFAQQEAELQRLHHEAPHIGRFMASDVLDALEDALNESCKDGFSSDLVAPVRNTLQWTWLDALDCACEKWLDNSIMALAKPMQQLGEAWDYSATQGILDRLRKGLRNIPHVQSRLDTVLTAAKPSIFSHIARLCKDDLDYVLNHMDDDAQQDAKQLQQAWQKQRPEWESALQHLSSDLVLRALMEYRQALQRAQSRLAILPPQSLQATESAIA